MPVEPDRGGTEALPPSEAFTLIGDKTRISILQALWDVYDPYAADNAITFAELFDRVGTEDTGNFNYHLGKLKGHFIRRTDAGYELTAPGFKIVRAIIGGGITGDPAIRSASVDVTCERCGSTVEISYEDGTTWARCSSCEGYWSQRGGEIFGFSLPPAGLRDREPNEILTATIVYSIHRFNTIVDGICPECGATVDTALTVCVDHEPEGGICDACGAHFMGIITSVCRSCKFAWRSPSYAPVSQHPALISFYYEHGIEHVPATWAAISRGMGWREQLLSTDPASLRLTVEYDHESRQFVLDHTGSVIEVYE
jgi:hypothetical protein